MIKCKHDWRLLRIRKGDEKAETIEFYCSGCLQIRKIYRKSNSDNAERKKKMFASMDYNRRYKK